MDIITVIQSSIRNIMSTETKTYRKVIFLRRQVMVSQKPSEVQCDGLRVSTVR